MDDSHLPADEQPSVEKPVFRADTSEAAAVSSEENHNTQSEIEGGHNHDLSSHPVQSEQSAPQASHEETAGPAGRWECGGCCSSGSEQHGSEHCETANEGGDGSCCACGRNCPPNPFTDAVNDSMDKCLDQQECCFEQPEGVSLASCCMSCGQSHAKSRCSRCRQVACHATCSLVDLL